LKDYVDYEFSEHCSGRIIRPAVEVEVEIEDVDDNA
jgi:hypothetical protein